MHFRILTLFITLNLTGTGSYGQNLIGFNGKEIQQYMKENRKDMSYEKVTNSSFKYLKYSDSDNSQTILFFLNNDSICKSIRLICTPGLKAEKKKEFNSIYKKSGENKWVDNRDGKDYLIKVRDEEWSCIITIEPGK